MLPFKIIKSMDLETLSKLARTFKVGTKEYHITWAYVWLLWAYKFQKLNDTYNMKLNLQWFISEIQEIHRKRGYP